MLAVGRKRKSNGKPPEQLGPNLRKLRDEKGLTGEQLQDASGVHRVTISEIERGNADATTETLLKLAAGLGVKPEELLNVPGQLSPIEPVIQEFLISPWRATTRPTEEEIDWLRSRPGSFWFGIKVSPATLAKAIEMYREEQRG